MDKEALQQELVYKAVRSSGPGGQHVNKVSSKVQLSFDLKNSAVLSEKEKTRLFDKLENQLNKKGVLQMSADESRSQLKNRSIVTQRFFELIEKSLKVRKKRKATKPSKEAVEKRLKEKKMTANKKNQRNKRNWDL